MQSSTSLTLLGGYGEAIGEAFQLSDDLLGIFGSPAVTGKPAGNDLREHKATSVVVAAHHLANPSLRCQLAELMSAKDLSDNDIRRWKTLIVATGAVDWIERSIDLRIRQRVALGRHRPPDDAVVRTALADMAAACTERAA